jgi:multidrug resistance efflux pump
MNIAVRVLLTLVLLISAGLIGYDMAVYYLYSPWTRDGRVRADVVTVAADVSGYVTDLRVRSNQIVKKGDILFVVDQARYRIALADAEAEVATRLAQYQMLQQQYERRTKLTLNLSITPEDLENAHRQTQSANAAWQQAIADRDLAALNLMRTEVRATVNGFVTNLNLQNGDYASPGKGMLALIDSDSYYVDAYLEETKIPQVKIGSPAAIRLMDGSPDLQGSVEGIARGITDYDNRDGPELLDSVNPTFTWVRLAQRVPVRIRITNVPPEVVVSAGMTCTVVLKDGAHPQIGASAMRLLAAMRDWVTGETVASDAAHRFSQLLTTIEISGAMQGASVPQRLCRRDRLDHPPAFGRPFENDRRRLARDLSLRGLSPRVRRPAAPRSCSITHSVQQLMRS